MKSKQKNSILTGRNMSAATNIKKYLAEIGRKGGQKSRRALTPEQARKMVEAREAKKKLVDTGDK
jgi:general stress protein YciG